MDFSRQVKLDGIGARGQQALDSGRVLIVGAGGLGCPAARYLAAAGVGHITLVDFDQVSASNLHRQILFVPGDEGQAKASLAAARLNQQAPGAVTGIDATFDPSMVAGHDVVLDCTDEPGTRALIHQACMESGTPLVWAAVEGWTAQWATVVPGKGPCLRCLWPTPAAGLSCADVGVLGPIVGMAGTWQALAALRLLAGIHAPTGVLWSHDLRTDAGDRIQFEQRADCPSCAAVPK